MRSERSSATRPNRDHRRCYATQPPNHPLFRLSLSEGQMAALKAIVLRGPNPAMDGIERWRIVDLCRVVAERWGVAYSQTGMLRLLWSLDLSHRKTRPVHPKSDPNFKKGGSPRVWARS